MEERRTFGLGTVCVEHDDDGGYVALMLQMVPEHWDDAQITEWVKDQWPAQHCQHSYDCCGRTYGGEGRWTHGPAMYHESHKLIVIRRGYRVNI